MAGGNQGENKKAFTLRNPAIKTALNLLIKIFVLDAPLVKPCRRFFYRPFTCPYGHAAPFLGLEPRTTTPFMMVCQVPAICVAAYIAAVLAVSSAQTANRAQLLPYDPSSNAKVFMNREWSLSCTLAQQCAMSVLSGLGGQMLVGLAVVSVRCWCCRRGAPPACCHDY